MTPKETLVEFRCPNDGRLLFKVSDIQGVTVEARCPRCKETITARRDEPEEDTRGG